MKKCVNIIRKLYMELREILTSNRFIQLAAIGINTVHGIQMLTVSSSSSVRRLRYFIKLIYSTGFFDTEQTVHVIYDFNKAWRVSFIENDINSEIGWFIVVLYINV